MGYTGKRHGSSDVLVPVGVCLSVTILGALLLVFFVSIDGGFKSVPTVDTIPVPKINFAEIEKGLQGRDGNLPPKMLVIIPIVEWPPIKPRNRQLIEEAIRVYSPRVQLKFAVSEKDFERESTVDINDLEPKIITVNSRMGRQAWDLTWRAWRKVAELYLTSADWFAMIDLNTLLVTTSAAAYVSYLDPNKPYYIGSVEGLDTWQQKGVLFNNPSAYILSREAVRRLSIRLSFITGSPSRSGDMFECVNVGGGNVGQRLSMCLREVGIEPMETRDSEGKQRFLKARPRNREDYKKCSSYPLSLGGIQDIQEYQTLEYYTLKQPYKDAFMGVEAPSGNPFRIQGVKGLNMDSNGDNPDLITTEPYRSVGYWLKSKEAPACLINKTPCECFVALSGGLNGRENDASACIQGSSIADKSTCAVTCGKSGPALEAKCDNGVLLLPPIKCQSTDLKLCKVPKPPSHTLYHPPVGTLINSKDQVTVTCSNNYRQSAGKTTSKAICFRGEIGFGSGCQPKGTWSIKIKGQKYQLGGWDRITFSGVATDEFEVLAVATGSKADPVKNCNQFGLAEQLLLVERNTGELVQSLSCSNQNVDVVETQFRQG
mmetsp:Transcript_32356/g.78718  ORF Transcript_32356/g.78718 Transcript_32356/m.78718 type:complete len:600 (+) Transcript_32356:305-2104(+)